MVIVSAHHTIHFSQDSHPLICRQITNSTSSSRPRNLASIFTGTDVKPALGTGFTYLADTTLLVQSTGKLFGGIDEGERDRVWEKPGLRAVVEVIKSRTCVSRTANTGSSLRPVQVLTDRRSQRDDGRYSIQSAKPNL